MCGIERKCLKCGEWKSPAKFQSGRNQCKVCRNEYILAKSRALRGTPKSTGPVLSCVVTGSPYRLANAIASAAGDGQIYAFRFRTGSVTWRKRPHGPEGAEFLGCYNPGCDYRQIIEDLQVAA